MNILRIVQIIGEGIILVGALFNVGLWVCNGFRLPKYIHGIAAVAFTLGGLLSYEVFLLGKSIISTLWFPFLFAGIVYIIFILHGAGIPSAKETTQASEEWKQAAKEQENAEEDEEDEEWHEPWNEQYRANTRFAPTGFRNTECRARTLCSHSVSSKDPGF